MDTLPVHDSIRNGDAEYEQRVRALLARHHPIASREDAARCFEALVAAELIQAEHLDTQPFRFFLCHELVGVHSLDLLFLMSAHMNLYAGTLMRLGSEKHRGALRRANRGQIGCFALTERRHGVTSGLFVDTVARYDREQQHFVLHTPSRDAEKVWITNAGWFAENAVVMARLVVGDEDHGLHAFLVPLRPARGAAPFAGITVEDVGPKTCLRATDTACLRFDRVIVPRDALLDRHTRIDDRGHVESDLVGLADHERFERVANQLLSGRLCVAGVSLALAEDALQKTVEHARRRRHRTGATSSLALFEHASYRRELVPLLAEAYVRRAFTSAVQRAYAASKTKTEPGLVRAICAAKATNAMFAREVLSTCQERLGSEGLLQSTGIGLAYDASYPAMLVEGDSRILLHKIAREALRELRRTGVGPALADAARSATPTIRAFRRATLGRLLTRRVRFQGLHLAFELRGKHGQEAADAWFESLEDEALSYGRGIADRLIWEGFAEFAGARDLVVDRLFALRCIRRDASAFARFAGVGPVLLRNLDKSTRELCDLLVPRLEHLMPAREVLEASREGHMDNVEIGKRHLEAYNNDNWDQYKADLADNVKYEELATRTTATGKDEYLEAVKRWKKGFPDTKAKILDSFPSGDMVISEVEWTGTHTGPLDSPFGTIKPTNTRGSVRAVLVTKFADGKIAEVRHYFDVMTILAQTGVLAKIGAAAERKAGEARPSAS